MNKKDEMQMKKNYKEMDKIHKNRKIQIDILKEKIIREDERKRLIKTDVIMVFILIITISIILILFICPLIKCNCLNNISVNINIPDRYMIKDFCISKGYMYGWLSDSSCGINQVMCHKEIGEYLELTINKCIDWEND